MFKNYSMEKYKSIPTSIAYSEVFCKDDVTEKVDVTRCKRIMEILLVLMYINKHLKII